ncbi:MAG: hypothetical protein ACOYMG_05730 [Candidatus Methylumidiphilus sp.]
MQVNPRGSESKLVERLLGLKPAAKDWVGVYFSLDKLQPKHQSNYYINIAVNIMDDVLRQCEAEAYVCKDYSIFLLCKSIQDPLLEKLIFQVRYLFIDDPISYNEEGAENDMLCGLYHFNRKLDEFTSLALSKVIGKIGGSDGATPAAMVEAVGGDASAIGANLVLLNAETMARVESFLVYNNIKSTVRRQSVYLFRQGFSMRKVFDELYIKINKLQELLDINASLHNNRWLFMYLTEILDAKMINLITLNQGELLNSSISLNLNISTLSSERFRDFNTTLKKFFKFALIVEVQLSDVIDHLRSFAVVRDLLHEMGHRICLDGLSCLGFTPVEYDRLGFDLVKLHWDAEMDTPYLERDLTEKIKAIGANRVILTRCDSQAAINYGQTLGIALFQGRYLDRLSDPNSTLDN